MAEPLQISVVLNAIDRLTGPARAAMGASQALADSLAATRRRMVEVDQANRNFEGYKRLKQQLEGVGTQMTAARERAAALARQIRDTENPSARLQAQFARARAEVNRLDQTHQQLTQRLQQTRSALTAAGVPMRSLTEAQRHLRSETERTTRTLEQQAGAFGRVLQQQQRISNLQQQQTQHRTLLQNRLQMQQDVAGVAYPTLAAGTGLLYAASKPVMESASLTDQVRDIAITGGMGKTEESALREQLRAVALKTNQEKSEVGKGVQILVANGMGAKDAGNYAELLGKTATASRAQMDDIANVTFTLQNNLKIQGKDAMELAMNNLVHSGKQGQFELKEMARYFPSMAAQMASMGGTGQEAVKELGIAMQAARKTAGTSGEAAANMSNWFSHMTAASTTKHFEEAGVDLQGEMLKRMNNADPSKRMGAFTASIDVFDQYVDKITAGKTIEIKNASGKVKQTLNFKDALAQAKAGGNESEVKAVVERFGLSSIIQDMQTANFYLAMRQNKDFIQKGMASFDGAGVATTIDDDMAKRLESPVEQFKSAKIGLADSLTQMGDAIVPMLTPFLQTINNITSGVTEWAKANPGVVSGIIKVAAVVGTMMVVFGGVTMAIVAVLGPLAMFRFALGMAGTQLRLFGAGAGMIGRLVTGIRGLAAGSGVLGRMGAALARLRSFLPSFSTLASGARMAGQAIMWLGRALLMNPIGLLVAAIAGAAYLIYKNWATIKPMLVSFWNSVKAAWASFKTWVSGLITGISTAFSNGWNKIKSATAEFASSIVGFFSGLPGKMLSVGGEIINGLWTGLKSKMSGVLDSVRNFASEIAASAKSALGINSPSRVFMEIGGHTVDGLGVGMQKAQPQLFQHLHLLSTALPLPLRGIVKQVANDPDVGRIAERVGNVIPLPTAANRGGNSHTTQQSITITINAAQGMDERAIAEAVARKLREVERAAAVKQRGRMYD